MASILNVFEPKTKIKSSEVNENFELVQKDVSEMGQALNTYVESEIASVQSTVGSVQATLQENINAIQATVEAIYINIAPDYSKGISISNDSTYTAPKSGWVFLSQRADNTQGGGYWINGVYFESVREVGDSQNAQSTCVFLAKNDKFRANYSTSIRFYPCRGAV